MYTKIVIMRIFHLKLNVEEIIISEKENKKEKAKAHHS